MSKPALNYNGQLNQWRTRGLIITDEEFALHCLAHHNYYRLSAYRFPFTVIGDPDRFLPNTTFDDIWRLYCFDRKLRQLVLEACKRVEISVRSRWAFEIGNQLGPQAYEDPKHFSHMGRHQATLQKLDDEIRRSKEDFISHYSRKYKTCRPEVWVVVEVASFGNISNFLKHSPQKIRQDVANSYRVDEKTLCSLFHFLSVLRNTAAHHSRIWNRKFVITLQLPTKKPTYLYQNFNTNPLSPYGRKIYNALVFLVHMMNEIEPQNTWKKELYSHIKALPSNLIPSMGFPPDWEQRNIWLPGL